MLDLLSAFQHDPEPPRVSSAAAHQYPGDAAAYDGSPFEAILLAGHRRSEIGNQRIGLASCDVTRVRLQKLRRFLLRLQSPAL